MPALTRTEAETRARQLTVHRYTIDLDLTRGEEVFGSTTAVRFSCAEPGGGTFLELRPAALRRVLLNGRELDVSALDDNRLPLTDLAAENDLLVEADMRYSRTGEGLHRFTDPVDGQPYLYAQCPVDDAQRIFPCFDQPDLKAELAVSVRAPEEWTVVSNGAVAERPEPGRWRFAVTPPLSSYLFTVVAGPYHSVRAEHAGLPFALHARASLAADLERDAKEIFDITFACFDRYRDIFAEPYPFDSYDQAFVPEFTFGAMENPGCVTFREDFVFRSAVTDTERQLRGVVIAHEMAHMWFGDLVTMRWWDDVWLNESFAEYHGYQVLADATRFTDVWSEYAARRKPWGYDADQRPSTHDVAPKDLPDTSQGMTNFDGISYAKGASALRQLEHWLGRETFLAGINKHFSRHRFGNATLADFLDALAEASGRDVHGWADRWLRTTGVDLLRVTETGAVEHHAPAGGPPRPHRLRAAVYRATDGGGLRHDRDLDLDLPADGTAPIEPLPVAADGTVAVLPNAGDLTYAKIRLDEGSWRLLTGRLGALPAAVDRAVVWNTARDRVRDADLAPAAYLDLVHRHLADEPDTSLVAGVLTFARDQVADRYLLPVRREEALAELARTCRRILARTRDDGLRLAAVRGLTATAVGEEGVDQLRRWLADDTVPGGPRMDPELRWAALLRLCVLGAAGPAEIDTEGTRDPSARGRESAARCRAALPDADAKEAAWQALFGQDQLSNYLLVAYGGGLWQPEQHELLADRVPRFFPDARDAARRGGPAVGMLLGRHAFPVYAVEEETLRLGEAALADPELPATLRRWCVDQLDDIRRALAVRRAHSAE